ncbi:MAG TPA: T9SS type A sorting domain-containing protein [Chromatiales bacterium]|nr:T9SS type A sorting domain-containing protein [Chromatiales bacterium]
MRALSTVAVTSIGFDYEPPMSLGTLYARIYEADGYARGALVAEGQLTLSSDVRQIWRVPVNAELREGHLYDIAAVYPVGGWSCRYEAGMGLPVVVGGTIEVLDGASDGNPSNSLISHFQLSFETQVGGIAVDLGQSPGVPPSSSTDASTDRSVYVFPVSQQDCASVGWFADIPEGETLTARIYNATGTTRGALVSEGTIVSSGAGERWHDVPVAGTFYGLQGYELSVQVGNVNLWRHWTVGIDYYATPEIQVYGAGGTGAFELPHLRFNGCYDLAPTAADGPSRPTRLLLRAPYPNPVRGQSLIEYQLERAGDVSIDVFDVRGRRVATLLETTTQPAGDGAVVLDAATLPAGVYFVRLKTPLASVSRKVSVLR